MSEEELTREIERLEERLAALRINRAVIRAARMGLDGFMRVKRPLPDPNLKAGSSSG